MLDRITRINYRDSIQNELTHASRLVGEIVVCEESGQNIYECIVMAKDCLMQAQIKLGLLENELLETSRQETAATDGQ